MRRFNLAEWIEINLQEFKTKLKNIINKKLSNIKIIKKEENKKMIKINKNKIVKKINWSTSFGFVLFLFVFVFSFFGNTTKASALAVGDSYGGGKVAYILQAGDPGYVAGTVKGLIAATDDQSTGVPWNNGTNLVTGATGTVLGTGSANTDAIISAQGAGSYAANIARSYNGGGYSDWYLPSLNELSKLYTNRTAIGGGCLLSGCSYWSSSEYDISNAGYVGFSNGAVHANYVKSQGFYLRSVRSFTAVTVDLTYSFNITKAGTQTITATYSSAPSTIPNISIAQQGTAVISAVPMTGSGTVYTYAYTVNPNNGTTYKDGVATVSLSNVVDASGNLSAAPTNNTFAIDTTGPSIVLNYSSNPTKAGTETITASYSEPISTAPTISIDQPGSTDVSNAAMVNASGTTWTAAASQTGAWNSITYGNGVFVALAGGSAMYSTNGTSWSLGTGQTGAWVSVTYGTIGGMPYFVAVGNGAVMYSTNGISWTLGSGQTGNWLSVAYGNGTFVAVNNGGTTMYSTNGTSWTLVTGTPNGIFYSVAYGNSKFVAVGNGGIVMYSTDNGASWTSEATQTGTWASITYGNSKFVAVSSSSGSVMYSTNGTSWTLLSGAVSTLSWDSIAYGNGLYVIFASNNGSVPYTSPDGITWTAQTLGSGYQWKSVAYGNGIFVAVATNSIATSPASNIWKYTYTVNAANSPTYIDGTATVSLSSVNDLVGNTASAPTNATFTIDTTGPTVALTYSKNPAGVGTEIINALYNEPTATAPTIAIDQPGTTDISATSMSAPGTTWTGETAAELNNWTSVAYGNNIFVAVSTDGTHRVMTSSNGTTWTSATDTSIQNTNKWNSITYGNGRFVAVSTDGKAMYSLNGTSWTLAGTVPEANTWNSVTYGTVNSNPLFVAVSNSGTHRVMISPDGNIWSTASASSASAWGSVAYGTVNSSPLFVAVGSGTDQVMTSSDGVNWSGHANAKSLTGIRFVNNLFFAFSYPSYVSSSPDGLNWTQKTIAGGSNCIEDIAYGNGRYSAIGEWHASGGCNAIGGISTDGTTFTGTTGTPSSVWNSITYGNNLFVAVAGTSSTDGVTRVMISPNAGPNTYNYAYTVNAANSPTYVDGTATVTLSSVNDLAGNASSAPTGTTFTIDTAVPTVALTYTLNPTKVGTETITATYSSAPSTIPNISIAQQGTAVISAVPMTGSGTVYTYDYTVHATDNNLYKDGLATVSLSAVTNLVGTTAATPTNTTFTVDTVNPVATITSICSTTGDHCTTTGAGLTPQQAYSVSTLAGTDTDTAGSGINVVNISVKDITLNKYLTGTTFTSDTEVYTASTLGTGTWTFDLSHTTLNVGDQYEVHAQTIDNATNSTIQTLDFIFTNSPPTISNVTASQNLTSDVITVNYDVTDNESANTTNSLFYGVGATLNGDITSGASSLTVSNATNFPATGTILIDNEIISYTGKSTNTLTGLTRGTGLLSTSTTAAAHTSTTPVYVYAPSATGTGIGSSAIGTGKTITWNAVTDTAYENATETIKVVANDGSTSWMLGTLTSSAFVFDTKAPTVVTPVTFDAGVAGVAGSATVTIPMPTDVSAVEYKISDDATTQTNPTNTGWVSITTNTTIPWTFDSDIEAKTLKYQFKDSFGNTTTEQTITTHAPIASSSFIAQDTSNLIAGTYDMYLGWAAGSATNFASYKLEYATSADNITYNAYTTISDTSLSTASTNFFVDRNLIGNEFYRFRLAIVDTNGNVSVRSSDHLTTRADGVQNYSEGGGGSVATATRVENVVVTQNTDKTVTVNYKLTDTSLTKKVNPSYEGYIFYNLGVTLPANAWNDTNKTLTLSNATKLPAAGYIQVNNEVLKYTSKTGNVLNGVTRGTWPTASEGRTTRQNTTFFTGTPVWVLANNTTPVAITNTSIATGQDSSITWNATAELALAGSSYSNLPVRVLVHDNQDALSGPLSTQSDYSENGILNTLDLTAPAISFDQTSATGDVSVTPAVVTINLASPYPFDSTVAYTVSGTAIGGGVDYTLANGTATITAGQTSTTISIPIVNHLLTKLNPTIILTLSNPTNATLGTNTVYTYTLTGALQDTTPPSVALSYSETPATVGTTETITATYSEPIASAPTISVAQQGSAVITNVAMTNAPVFVSDYPPAQSDTYVKATSSYPNTFPYMVTDPTQLLTGQSGWDTPNGPPQERFHIDLGSAKTISRIYYENGHYLGTIEERGVKDFTFWGSNDANAFNDLTYGDDTGWTQLTTDSSQFTKHIAQDVADPHYIGVTNSTAYRYYAFKFADNWGNGYMSVQRIELQEQKNTTFSYDYTVHQQNGTTYKDGTATVSLSSTQDAAGNISAAPTNTTFTIQSTQVQFDEPGSAGLESVSTLNIPVSIAQASTTNTTVDYAVDASSTAVSGTDYTIANGNTGTLTIPAGQTTTNIAVTVIDGKIKLVDKNIVLTLSNPTNSTLGTNTTYTYTIQNSNTPTIAFDTATGTGTPNTTPVLVPISLSIASGMDTTIDYTVSGTAQGSGVNYTLDNGTVTIPAGQTTANISIDIANHLLSVPSMNIVLTLSNPTNATIGTNAVYTYTITANNITVQFSDASSAGSQNVSLVNIPVALTSAYPSDVTVDYAVDPSSTAVSGTDYTIDNLTNGVGTLTIPSGQTLVHIPVNIIDTKVFAPDKTLVLTLSNPTEVSLGTNATYTYTINNDNAPVIQFANASASGPTSVTPVLATINLSTISTLDTTVAYTVSGTAVNGTDYNLTSDGTTLINTGTVTIPAGQTSANISIPIIDHVLSQPNATIIITLSAPTNATLGTNAVYTYTLTFIGGANIKSTSAIISWTTDAPSDSLVEYGPTAPTDDNPDPYTGKKQDTANVLEHNVYIGNLTPSTTYYARITSVADGVPTISYSQFTTTAGPVISGVSSTAITDTSATINWTTDIPTTSYVNYSTDSGLANPKRFGMADLVTAHSVVLTNLDSAVPFYFSVDGADANSNVGEDANDNDGTTDNLSITPKYYTFTTAPDTTPPVISTPQTPIVTSTQVAITWNTNEPADGIVKYGTTSGVYDKTTDLISILIKSHLVAISGLEKSTQYYYVVVSADANHNSATSPEGTFTTTLADQVTIVNGGGSIGVAQSVYDALLAENEALQANAQNLNTTAPVISNIKISDVTSFTATVSFDTDQDTEGFIRYGKDKGYGFIAADENPGKNHSIQLNGLSFGTDYYFVIDAKNNGSKITTSDEQNFKTKFFSENLLNAQKLDNVEQFQSEVESTIESILPSLAPPFLEEPIIGDITENSASVSFKTNIKSYPVINYTTDANYDATKDNPYDGEISDTTSKTIDHKLVLNDLKPNTKYHVMAKAFSLPQVVGKSDDITFTTKPSKIQGSIINVKTDSFTVVWNTDTPSSSIVDYKNVQTGITARVSDDTKNTSHSVKVENLPSGTSYEVSISGVNEQDNTVEAGSVLDVKTSTDTTPPVITNVKVDSTLIVGQTNRVQTIISWTTDKPSTSTVYYEEGAGSADKQLTNKQENLELTKNHAVILTIFKPGTIYRFTVSSTDGADNTATLPVRTIITPQQAESIMDIIFKNFDQTFNFINKAK